MTKALIYQEKSERETEQGEGNEDGTKGVVTKASATQVGDKDGDAVQRNLSDGEREAQQENAI